MRIVICGSLAATQEILDIQAKLLKQRHLVVIPHGVRNQAVRERVAKRRSIVDSEEAEEKQKYDVIRKYYEEIRESDAILVVNPAKNNIPGYIGGNTFLEMGFAYVLDKPTYCLYPLPDMPYLAELIALKPIIINGDINKIKR